ncbi:hypothetical protein JCM19233_3933 [Vibrio astriarenae]|nr:hypothetical protein JCM19233_3933 [Vibrio sp. C7]
MQCQFLLENLLPNTITIRSANPGHTVPISSTTPRAFVPVQNQGDILADGAIFSE